MKCLLNPMTSEMKRVSDSEAKHLASYGWRYVSKTEYKAWQVKRMQEARR